MVGIIGVQLSPLEMFNAIFGFEPKTANLNGDEVMYIFNNKHDCEFFDFVYDKDSKENRLDFLDKIKELNYNFLSEDVHNFLSMKDTETFYKIGGFNV